MPGINKFSTEENAIGIFESKADVLVYYRSQKLTDAVLNYLDYLDLKNK